MDLLTCSLVALGLAADAFAVAVTNGICCCKVTKNNIFATAFTFGFFQGLMPILGFFLGKTFSDFINRYQHFIALILLGAIGANMIAEAVKEHKNPEAVCPTKDIFAVKNLILQGIATSIDAFAVGVGFAAMNVNILTSSLLIAFITFVCCIFGVYIGKRFGTLLGMRARFVGGFLLILIGVKLFFENM